MMQMVTIVTIAKTHKCEITYAPPVGTTWMDWIYWCEARGFFATNELSGQTRSYGKGVKFFPGWALFWSDVGVVHSCPPEDVDKYMETGGEHDTQRSSKS